MPATTVERPAGYIVGRMFTSCGRRLEGGQPVPAQAITPTLESLGWIVPVGEAEFEKAIAIHGRPPTDLRVGWDFEKDDPKPPPVEAPPRKQTARHKRTKKKAKRRARS